MKKFILFVLFISLSFSLLKAQYDAQFSNYWAVKNYYNPAEAGQSGNLDATALHRSQWLSFPGAPKSIFISGDMPMQFLNRTHGVGAVFFSESIGLFQHNIVAAQYAYKTKLFGGVLSVGLQAGLISESFDGSKIYIPTSDYHVQEDEGIPTATVSGKTFDLAAGIAYNHDKWYVGLSSSHLTEPEIALEESAYMYVSRTYYLMGGYNIQLNNPLLQLQPSVFVKSIVLATQVDVNLKLWYNKMFMGGLGWRMGDAGIVTIGAKFGKIQAGYAYDFPISIVSKASTGSHEIFLKYSVDLSKGKRNKNKHKSVRIL